MSLYLGGQRLATRSGSAENLHHKQFLCETLCEKFTGNLPKIDKNGTSEDNRCMCKSNYLPKSRRL